MSYDDNTLHKRGPQSEHEQTITDQTHSNHPNRKPVTELPSHTAKVPNYDSVPKVYLLIMLIILISINFLIYIGILLRHVLELNKGSHESTVKRLHFN